MREIKFLAAYGDWNRTVEISEVSGALGAIHIYIDRFYSGNVINRQGKWMVDWVMPGPRSVHQELMTMDDSDAVLDRMIEAGWIEDYGDKS